MRGNIGVRPDSLRASIGSGFNYSALQLQEQEQRYLQFAVPESDRPEDE